MRENVLRPCPVSPGPSLASSRSRRRRPRARTRRGPSCPRKRRRSSRPPSTPPTARSCTRSTRRRTARSSRSSRSRAHVRDAVIAIEDERYYRHNGVDVRGVLRAARTNAAAGDVEQGGSTITQQYVKQEILQDSSQTVTRKVQEAALAIQLERDYSKDRILELYLNAIYFGNGAYGIEAAAHQYFGKPASDLTIAEARADRGGDPAARRHRSVQASPGSRSSAASSCSTGCSPTTSITEAEYTEARETWLAARLGGGARRRALPGGVLRGGGEAVDPRRPPLRSDAPRSAVTSSSEAGCASTPPSTSWRRPRPRPRSEAILPDPNGPGRVARRRWRRARATCGRWWAAVTSSARARSPS